MVVWLAHESNYCICRRWYRNVATYYYSLSRKRHSSPAVYTVSRKKGATDFFAVTYTNIAGFSYLSCTTSQENAKVIGVKISCHTFVVLLPYRVKVSDTKVTHSHNTSTLHMFISITFRATSIDETNKTQQKVRVSKFMFKMSTIHANTCIQTTMPLRNHCRDEGVHGPVASTPSADVLSSTQIMDPRAVDPLLKHIPDAVVHRIQIWRIGGHISGGINSGVSLSAAWWQCHVHDLLVPHLAKNVVIPENWADIQQKHI